jgi:hypothetical protein
VAVDGRSVKKAAASIQENDKVRKSRKVTRRALSFTIPGVDFEPHFDRLLKLAGAVNTADTRLSLNSHLSQARSEWDMDLDTRKGRIPTEELSTLESGIKRVQNLLRKSEKYLSSHRLRFVHCPVGEGTVATQTFERGKWGETVPFPPDPLPPVRLHFEVPPGGMMASINIRRTLEIVLLQITRAKRSKARPREEGKRMIVAYAAKFFREHSTASVTSYPTGAFANFCRSFYEAATGVKLLDVDGLQFQIRAEVKTPTFRIQIPQKHLLESSTE